MTAKLILLIDDDPSVTTLLSARLRAVEGITTHTLNNAGEALETAAALRPDLVVCDIDFGDEETVGGDIAYDLANDPRTATIPLVFLSSMITSADTGRRTGKALMVAKKSGVANVVNAVLAELKAHG